MCLGHDQDQSSSAVVARMVQQAREVLDPLVPPGSRVALVDFPNHNNSGDSAIWVGERTWLASIGATVAYACDVATYDPATLERRLSDGIILIHGGGNLGDVWPSHQAFRERVIANHVDTPIVQLPQTAHFSDPDEIARFARIASTHPALTVFVRDQDSAAVITEGLGIEPVLCPDMAFFIGRMERPSKPEVDVLWIERPDHESLVHAPSEPTGMTLRVSDWLTDQRRSKRALLRRYLTVRIRTLSGQIVSITAPDTFLGSASRRLRSLPFDWLAARRLANGAAILSAGRVVVTDRLHGHILCLLLDIPHVVIPDRHGKISAFRESFTRNAQVCVPAENARDAIGLARSLLT